MQLGSLVLITCALLFGGFGLAFLMAPAERIAAVGLLPQSATAVTELRAYYGAFQIGLALFLGLCAWRSEWRSAGLALLAITASALVTGRCIGLLLDGGSQPVTWQLLAVEASIAGLAAFAWWRNE